jgi:uncharacterized hydrophobic protein (TIGR00341 family)
MALRLIELILPKKRSREAPELIREQKPLGIWYEDIAEDKTLIRILLTTEATEAVLDIFEKNFSGEDEFRVILFPVEASLPRLETPEEKPPEPAEEQQEQPAEEKVERISREELYQDVVDASRISRVYVMMTILSTIVAAIGLLQDSVAIIIGAMVIAPLLGPNVAFSLATTLGDTELARNSLKTSIAGIFLSLVFSVMIGFIFKVTPDIPQIASRIHVGIASVVLALASGSAGALAFTSGVSAALIGVMVAVALLPPLVTFGMLLGGGHLHGALGALILLFTNIICVNLAGVVTFLLQGIRPLTWWEADRAKKATRIAILLWVSLLAILIAVILISRGRSI